MDPVTETNIRTFGEAETKMDKVRKNEVVTLTRTTLFTYAQTLMILASAIENGNEAKAFLVPTHDVLKGLAASLAKQAVKGK